MDGWVLTAVMKAALTKVCQPGAVFLWLFRSRLWSLTLRARLSCGSGTMV